MLEVAAAIIYVDNKILCFQRGLSRYEYTSFKYEFPGGKIEAGESPEEALSREILEELGVSVRIGRKLITIVHNYPDFSITMHCYICRIDELNYNLTEHIDCIALEPHELDKLDWVEADLSVINLLMSRKNGLSMQ